eukprot:scaffold5477_cov20-Prasinocladus_malaysianus.AAC.1
MAVELVETSDGAHLCPPKPAAKVNAPICCVWKPAARAYHLFGTDCRGVHRRGPKTEQRGR